MKLYIDDVSLDKIKELSECYPIDGVTSNPTILMKNGKEPLKTLSEIRAFLGEDKDLMTQVISTNAEDMVKEMNVIVGAIGNKNTYVKVPTNEQGLKAIKIAKSQYKDIKICATAIYTVAQGLLAAKAGADLVAPYVNRIDNLGGDGIYITKSIQDILVANNMSCGVIAASFKNTLQVIELAKYGVASATMSPDIWKTFLKNEVVDAAVNMFNSDFEKLVGEGKTFLNL